MPDSGVKDLTTTKRAGGIGGPVTDGNVSDSPR